MEWIAKPIADSSWTSLHDITHGVTGQFGEDVAIAFVLSPNPQGHPSVVVKVPKHIGNFLKLEEFTDLIVLDIPGREPAYYVRSEVLVHEPPQRKSDDELGMPTLFDGIPT